MRGIILAGGAGSRLRPITRGVSKQLIPVYDKPMVYYPLSTLIMAGIREILIITTPTDADQFERLLGDGSEFGISLDYAKQPHPGGLAQAFLIGANFLGKGPAALILGDNLFHGPSLGTQLRTHNAVEGALIFAYHVSNPSEYGVVEFDVAGRVVSLEEKPSGPRSSYAVPGLYFYDNDVLAIAKSLRPSERGELEITDVNRVYLENRRLHVQVLPRGTAWLDTGTFDSLMAAGEFVKVVEARQGQKVGCPIEAAWRSGFIDDDQLERHGREMYSSGYGAYLLGLINDGVDPPPGSVSCLSEPFSP